MTKKIDIKLDEANENWLASQRKERAPESVEDQAADIVSMHHSEGLGHSQALGQLIELGYSQVEAEAMLVNDEPNTRD